VLSMHVSTSLQRPTQRGMERHLQTLTPVWALFEFSRIQSLIWLSAGQPEGFGGVSESSGADKGRGPRIYVGGIPTAVSETMVRNHFSQWGQVIGFPMKIFCLLM